MTSKDIEEKFLKSDKHHDYKVQNLMTKKEFLV